MNTRKLGHSGPQVSKIGLGAVAMSDLYGHARDDAESLATLHAGITLIDTGDFYGSGHNEMLIGTVIGQRRRDELTISVKFGSRRDPSGGWQPVGVDIGAVAVKDRLAYTLQRLRTDYVDIYRPTRLNPDIPIEETVGAVAELVQAGFVRFIGLSEVGAETLRRAAAVHPISDLQIEYSLLSRGIEDEILPTARELGMGITAYGVLSRGLLSGHWRSRQTTLGDFRAAVPRFQGENLEQNLALVDALTKVAEGIGASTAQVAVAWVASRGDDIVPLIGPRQRQQLTELLGAADLVLTDQNLADIEQAVPLGAAAGDRYPPQQMSGLDSER
ncbi:aldo/keto reductase [Deinococcus sp.]|uniref:aldo/keto reductase n=1 Tax=Deinococcus sp. TaxID=47478 RepID=UPI003B5923E4